jgi:hypothetical protein
LEPAGEYGRLFLSSVVGDKTAREAHLNLAIRVQLTDGDFEETENLKRGSSVA